MSIRVTLTNAPDFYTSLDEISGNVILSLNRPEQVSNIVVKLEGEAITAVQVPHPAHLDGRRGPPPGPPGSIVSENHKILYRVSQVFPDEYHSSQSNVHGAFPLQPGEHSFPWKFKFPINNACSDPLAMSKIGGLAGLGGFSGGGLFGKGSVRVMDGSKQLFLKHTTRTLPPSLTNFPQEAEIRYYIKVTVQRPGFLKENWRFVVGLKFLPIEPPRPKSLGQEAFARRPFTFKAPVSAPPEKSEKKLGMFTSKRHEAGLETDSGASTTPPSVEVAARLPHPTLLTCNKSVPLRLIVKKLVDSPEQVYLTSFHMELRGITEIRAYNLFNRKLNRWDVISQTNLEIPLTSSAEAPVGSELVLPDDIWKNVPLPNTVTPSFDCCNISRSYELDIKLGLMTWGKPSDGSTRTQVVTLPLQFAKLSILSGVTPPPELVEAAKNTRPGDATISLRPQLPPRRPVLGSSNSTLQSIPQQAPAQPAVPSSQPSLPSRPAQDPLYPPQLAPGDESYDDAPPSYDDAVAQNAEDNLAGPFDGMNHRPAYSGVTDPSAVSQMPQGKN